MQQDNHHIFPEFDIHNQLVGVKCDLGSVLLIVVIPNNYLISCIFVD